MCQSEFTIRAKLGIELLAYLLVLAGGTITFVPVLVDLPSLHLNIFLCTGCLMVRLAKFLHKSSRLFSSFSKSKKAKFEL